MKAVYMSQEEEGSEARRGKKQDPPSAFDPLKIPVGLCRYVFVCAWVRSRSFTALVRRENHNNLTRLVFDF